MRVKKLLAHEKLQLKKKTEALLIPLPPRTHAEIHVQAACNVRNRFSMLYEGSFVLATKKSKLLAYWSMM